MIEMNGKKTQLSDCHCCNRINKKKITVENDKSYKAEGRDFFSRLEPNVISYDGTDEYPQLVALFSPHGEFRIDADHPVGEDVVNFKGQFYGYADEWCAMLRFAEKTNRKFNHPDEVSNFYYEKMYPTVVNDD